MDEVYRSIKVMDEINKIEDNDCWALTEMINQAEMQVIALGSTIAMLEAYNTASLNR